LSDIDCTKQEKEQKEAFAFVSIGLSVLIVALLVFVHRKRKRILHLIGKVKAEYERLVSKLKEMGKPIKRNVRRR
ncbi:MAG: LPXTG cell wall anchor domain-containing protein, partial [Candidatus Nanoarchaeia archaeon]|jgi:LPXTG-motif cell wall-anchored protein